MSYIVYARKYRPKTLKEISAQEHVTTTLINAIKQNKISHAYIFSGIRGTGKTTTARALAKSLNCQNGPTPSPCNNCTNCKEIDDGNSIDVIEIDAASNRGIDEIRALRENVKYVPAKSKYKIYIIDEAHQITEPAFNALLKTLEEPPPHVVFILATTQPEKIPLTISSRCQHFLFRPVPKEETIKKISEISKLEKLKLENNVFELIAQLSQGSLRDALGIIDQISPYAIQKKLTVKEVREILGLIPQEIITSLVSEIIKREPNSLLQKINQIASYGYDFLQISKELRDYFRMLLLYKNEIPPENKLYPEEIIKNHSSKLTQEEILRNIEILTKCIQDLKWSEESRLIFEFSSMKMLEEYVKVEELVKRLDEMEEKFEKLPEKKLPEIEEIPPVVLPKEEKKISPKQIEEKWESILDKIKQKKPIIGPILGYAHMEAKDETIRLTFSLKTYHDMVKSFQDEIEGLLREFLGSPIKLEIFLSEEPIEAKEEPQEQPETDELDPRVKKVIEKLGGRVIEEG